MEEMRLDNEPAEATLDQTIILNSVFSLGRTQTQPRALNTLAQKEDRSAASTLRIDLFLFNPKRPKSVRG